MEEINLKILLVGDSDVGKTSLLSIYTDNKFLETHLATIGVEFRVKTIIKRKFKINLQIWDTAGQERFRSITKNFFYNADGILFVYDITNHDSFEGVKVWIKESESFVSGFKKILLGNKVDIENERKVTKEEVEKYCKEIGILALDTSAKIGKNINQAFENIVNMILEGKSDEDIRSEYGNKNSEVSQLSKTLTVKQKTERRKCC